MMTFDSLPPDVAWFFNGELDSPHAPRTWHPDDPTQDDAELANRARSQPPPASPCGPVPLPAPQPHCKRVTPRQATSAVAHERAGPGADDPLLAFAPFIHRAPRRNSITPELQRRFVATLAATGIVVQAARSIGKSMEALYKLKRRPGAQGFSDAWDAALRWGLERLEDCAMEAALRCDDEAANSMLAFVLTRRDRLDYIVDLRDLEPGHPVYDGIAAETLRQVGFLSP